MSSVPSGESTPLATLPVATEMAPTAVPIAAPEPPLNVANSNGNVRIVEKVEMATMTDMFPIEREESESAAQSSKVTACGDVAVSCCKMPQQLEQPLVAVQCEPAATVTENSEMIIKETIKEMETLELDDAAHAEEPDTLSPLMTDNYTYLQHQELLREEGDANPQHHYHHHHHHHGHDEIHDYDLDDDEEEDDDLYMEDDDHMVPHPVVPPVNMKHSDTKDSISSIDSDVSMSYDRTNSTESQNPPEDAGVGSSDDNAKDSGCEITKKPEANSPSEEDAYEIPDDDMCEKIIEQVEFYFSNDNILKDAFLLKHVRRNKEGFVSLKLVSSFKRVRQLTKDWRVVGYAIKRKSVKIELNDLGTKIRRLESLPIYDETTPSRTVVATGLPYDKYTVEKVSELFSKCGEISLIRVLRPGGPIPADVRQFINKHPELQQNECALIEFTESASARRAQNMEEFIVLELIAPKKKTGKKANVTRFVENYKYVAGHDIERSRGGETFDRYKMRRGSGFYPKPEMQHVYQQMIPQPEQPSMQQIMPLQPQQQPQMQPSQQQQQQQPQQQPIFIPHPPQQRKYSYGNENYDYFNRRPSTFSMGSSDASRKYSSCSDGYSSCGEMSRRPSQCSSGMESMSRRTSNCSEVPSRRTSNCSDFCSCSRRVSQCSDAYRRISQCSDQSNRKFSVGSNFERRFTNSPDMGMPQRRISMESNYERKFSTGSNMYENPNMSPRKYSNGFDPLRKLSSSSEYYNGRRISTDSGYDRRISVGSECSNGGPRSRSGSAVQMQCHQHGQGETVVRTPIGPDGSKGFGSRTRRIGQIVPPA
ncbi:uncharacterized protein LOC131439504 [Malaya genurostris]|uniref:uncharacterized protein LOC131439504 n=1 Tax=Malaya genurostris TaxID=325434 RepID=UPI0026F381ED|nr:uncharacterized protein LOC131439504 [Malaya genurostris]